jgi:hypothetical protein
MYRQRDVGLDVSEKWEKTSPHAIKPSYTGDYSVWRALVQGNLASADMTPVVKCEI